LVRVVGEAGRREGDEKKPLDELVAGLRLLRKSSALGAITCQLLLVNPRRKPRFPRLEHVRGVTVKSVTPGRIVTDGDSR